MKNIRISMLLAVAMVLLAGTTYSAFACWCGPGTGTPGYWKNHPEAWPVEVINIGGVNYEKADAIALIDAPVKGDKTLTMFAALVAAKLNVLAIAAGGSGCNGCNPPGCILEADQWLVYFPVESNVRGNTEAWQYSHGEALYLCMDDYNNGRLCAPSRDYCENN